MDYLIDGIEVQSKFINGTNKNLMHILKHMDEYSNFGKDGSFYHIPKDTWQEIQDVLDGKPVEGLKSTTIEAIKAKSLKLRVKHSGLLLKWCVRASLIIKMCN